MARITAGGKTRIGVQLEVELNWESESESELNLELESESELKLNSNWIRNDDQNESGIDNPDGPQLE